MIFFVLKSELIERCLRLAFEYIHFCETTLYSSIQLWQQQNQPYKVLKSQAQYYSILMFGFQGKLIYFPLYLCYFPQACKFQARVGPLLHFSHKEPAPGSCYQEK